MADSVDILAIVERSVRSDRRLYAWLGGILTLLGGGLMVLILFAKGTLLGKLGAMAMFGLVFALPGVLLLRKRLRPLSSVPIVRLLSSGRAEISRVYPRYVSYNNGPTTAQLHVVDGGGGDHYVQVPIGQIKSICRQLAEQGVTVTNA